TAIAVFVDIEITRADFLNGGEVIEFAVFTADGDAASVDDLVFEKFGGAEMVDSFGELHDTLSGASQHLFERTGNAGLHGRDAFVNVGGHPFGGRRQKGDGGGFSR